eukprot:1158400-Pelagomonas_calceolata.AAC.9
MKVVVAGAIADDADDTVSCHTCWALSSGWPWELVKCLILRTGQKHTTGLTGVVQHKSRCCINNFQQQGGTT